MKIYRLMYDDDDWPEYAIQTFTDFDRAIELRDVLTARHLAWWEEKNGHPKITERLKAGNYYYIEEEVVDNDIPVLEWVNEKTETGWNILKGEEGKI